MHTDLDGHAAAQLDELLLHPAADAAGLAARNFFQCSRAQLRHARLIRHHPHLRRMTESASESRRQVSAAGAVPGSAAAVAACGHHFSRQSQRNAVCVDSVSCERVQSEGGQAVWLECALRKLSPDLACARNWACAAEGRAGGTPERHILHVSTQVRCTSIVSGTSTRIDIQGCRSEMQVEWRKEREKERHPPCA